MGAEIYILISFHIVNQYHVKTDFFFPTKSNMITNVILILYSSSIKKNLKVLCLKYQNRINAFVTAG